jgi:hypothetical protein
VSHQASAYVKALGRDQVTRRQKLVLMVLADYHSTETNTAYPSSKTLARESLMDERELQRVLNELEGRILERVPGQGSGHTTAYRFIALDKEIPGYIAPFLRGQNPGQKGGQNPGQNPGQKGGQNPGQIDSAIRKEELEPEPELEQEGGTAKTENQPLFSDSQPPKDDLAEELCERIAFPATRPHVDLIAAVLKVIQKKHSFATLSESAEYLEACVEAARREGNTHLQLRARFFFEDGEYELFNPETVARLERERAKRREAEANAAKPPTCIVGKCLGCGREKLDTSTWTDYCADSCRDAAQKRAMS